MWPELNSRITTTSGIGGLVVPLTECRCGCRRYMSATENGAYDKVVVGFE
jgi:hypothetical protein